jgi:hypothetical protein
MKDLGLENILIEILTLKIKEKKDWKKPTEYTGTIRELQKL